MKIHTLTMDNFRAYSGEQRLDLTPKNKSSLILIDGQNMQGKTSLFMAIRWCLYGEVKDRLGNIIPIVDFDNIEKGENSLLNKKAFEDENYAISVQIVFEHEDKIFNLKRGASSNGEPTDNKDFKEDLSLTIESENEEDAGNILEKTIIKDEIARVLDPHAAEFFFFDGETLSRYEDIIKSKDSTELKKAISATVGTAALHAEDTFKELVAQYRRKMTSAQKSQDKLDAKVKQLEDWQKEREENVNRKPALEEEIGNLTKERDEIVDRSEDNAKWQEAKGKLNELSDSITEEEEKIDDRYTAIQGLVEKKFWLLAGKKAKELRDKKLDQITAVIETAPHLSSKTKEDQVCVICNQDVKKGTKPFEHVCATIEENSDDFLIDVEDLRDAFKDIELLNRFTDEDTLEVLKGHETAINVAQVEINEKRGEEKDLRDQTKTPRTKSDDTEKLTQLTEEITSLESELAGIDEDIEELDGLISDLEKDLETAGSNDEIADKRLKTAKFLEEVFSRAVGKFDEQAREKINNDASGALKELIKIEGYHSLKIHDDYSVSPVDKKGNPQQNPSAGGQQQLTTALLAGLNNNSVYKAPIIMDTPFGRLDMENRENTLKWVDGLIDQQVILMVHDGELAKEQLKRIPISIGRQFLITRDSVNSSSIEEL